MRQIAYIFLGLMALVSGCTYYQVTPTTSVASSSQTFDRAWSATRGAFQDQGVSIVLEDRSAGILRGKRHKIAVTATLVRRDNGGVRVQFDTSGDTASDATLIQRISRSYDVRMGR